MTSRPSSRRRSPRRRRRSPATPSRSSSMRCRRSTGAAPTARRRSRSRCRSSSRRFCPNSVYASLPAPFNERHVPLGLQHQRRGRGVAGASRSRSRSARRDHRDLHEQPRPTRGLQSLLTVDQTIHWADPLGTTAHNNCVNGPPLAAACTQPYTRPDPGGRPPARQRGAVAVRRPSRRLVDAGLRSRRAAPSSAPRTTTSTSRRRRRSGSTTTRSGRAPERLRRARRLLLDSRQPRHRPRQQPDHAAGRQLTSTS